MKAIALFPAIALLAGCSQVIFERQLNASQKVDQCSRTAGCINSQKTQDQVQWDPQSKVPH